MGAIRKQRARGTFTREQVVDAGLAVVDRAGVEHLTIRAVATALGAPPMSLYSHFSTKQELLDLMFSEMTRRMYEDNRRTVWQEELIAVAQRARHVLREHPNWAALLSRPAPPVAVPVRERLLEMMTADGLDAESAFEAISVVLLQTIGLVLVELELRGPGPYATLSARFERLKQRAESTTPLTREALSKIDRFDLAKIHDLSLTVFVEGLSARARAR